NGPVVGARGALLGGHLGNVGSREPGPASRTPSCPVGNCSRLPAPADAECQDRQQRPQRRARHAPRQPHPPPRRLPPAHLGTAFVTELRGGREWGSARMTGHRGRNLTGRNPKGSVLYFSWPLTSPCVAPSLRPSDGRPLPRPGARPAPGRTGARPTGP